jgi:hypothetical protein
MYRSTFFPNSAVVGGDSSGSRPGHFTPGEKAPLYELYKWLGGPRADLEHLEKRKLLSLTGTRTLALGRPLRRQSLYILRYPGFSVYIMSV